MNKKIITIVGAGLAGCEAALTLAKAGHDVHLYEMRPIKTTPAHKTANFAELVCSNSLKGTDLATSQGLLKAELNLLSSTILPIANANKVPAGGSLSVNRETFSKSVTNAVKSNKNITIINEEFTTINEEDITLIASGPLTSKLLSTEITNILGSDSLYFFDAISPIISFDSIDMSKAFFASRYDKGGKDFINCPMDRDEYFAFYKMLVGSEKALQRDFEPKKLFDACMPVEELAAKGEKTLTFGPLKPVGLEDPITGKRFHAVLQLRKEDSEGTSYNMVGFQTRLTYPEQKRVFSIIPGLENSEFLQYGSMHRNTYINSPMFLNSALSLRTNSNIFFAGQITGGEGYNEAIATGKIAALSIISKLSDKKFKALPKTTITGALIDKITDEENTKKFRPINGNFGIIPMPTQKIKNKQEKKKFYANRSIKDLKEYLN